MAKKIFRSILLAAAVVLLANLVIIMGCLYNYFMSLQEQQLRDELRLAAYGVEENGLEYLERLTDRDYRYTWKPDYRLTWVASTEPCSLTRPIPRRIWKITAIA